MKKKLISFICAIALIMLMTVPAAAYTPVVAGPDVKSYSDVPRGSDYYESVAWATSIGVTAGTSDTTFSPDMPVTFGQWCIMLQRLMRPNANMEMWTGTHEDFYEAYVAAARDAGWIPGGITLLASSPLTHETLYAIGFSGFYLDYNGTVDWENVAKLAADEGVHTEAVRNTGLITRGEAVTVLHALCAYSDAIEASESGNAALVSSPYGAVRRDYIRQMDTIPQPVMDKFAHSGWTVSVDPKYIADYSEAVGRSIAGLCVYSEKRIYVNDPGAIIHEVGHFVDYTLGFSNEDLFSEADASQFFLREYSKTNAKEYFADYFSYFIRHRNDSWAIGRMSELTPESYSRFSELEENGWAL